MIKRARGEKELAYIRLCFEIKARMVIAFVQGREWRIEVVQARDAYGGTWSTEVS